MYVVPGDIHYVDRVGYSVQDFTPRGFYYYLWECVPRYSRNYIHPQLRQDARKVVNRLYNAITHMPYFRRLTDPVNHFVKESLVLTPSGFEAIHLCQYSPLWTTCTMREVFSEHMIIRQAPKIHGECLWQMSLELYILQYLKHKNVVDLLSVDFCEERGRHIMIYETSVPLLYYMREAYLDYPEQYVSLFFDQEIPKYILKCIADALSHLTRFYIALGGRVDAESVYIDINGVPKLGKFLEAVAVERNDVLHHKEDLASAAGLFVAMCNRAMPEYEMRSITELSKDLYPLFTSSYFHNTHNMPVYKFHPWKQQLTPENMRIAKRCFLTLADYRQIAHGLDIEDAPDKSYQLQGFMKRFTRQFAEPVMRDDQLPPHDIHLRPIVEWKRLTAHITIDYDDEFTHFIEPTTGADKDFKRELTFYLCDLILNPRALPPDEPVNVLPMPNVFDQPLHNPLAANFVPWHPPPINPDAPPEDEYNRNPFDGPYKPEQLLNFYPFIVRAYNKWVELMDRAPEVIDDFEAYRVKVDGHVGNLDGENKAYLEIIIKALDGRRIDPPAEHVDLP